MNSYLQVTTRYLKVQKKRTALTILGIILSVALITGIGTILESIRDKFVRDAMKESGSYHIMFEGVDANKVDNLRKHTGVEYSGLERKEGYAVIGQFENMDSGNNENGSEQKKPKAYNQYLEIKECNTEAMGLLPINIYKGRLPEAAGEIAIDNWVLSRLPGNPSIGDSIKLDTGIIKSVDGNIINNNRFNPGEEIYEKAGRKEYTIVGLLKPQYYYTGMNIASGISYLDSSKMVQNNKYNVYVKITDFKNSISNAQKMVKDAGLEQEAQKSGMVKTNERVLRLYGESVNETFGNTFMILVVFVIAIVVVCMIAVIYNAFNISVLERVSQFGLLRCVGAASGQIRKIVLREAMLLSAAGIPIGLLCGTLAMKVLFNVIASISPNLPFNDLKVVISPQIIAASILLGLFTVLLSAYGPARHAARIAPMDALRNTGSYRKESFKKIKKSRLSKLLFGVEGWIAWKNLRRNHKRFVITVFSMVISIVLYIVFNSIFSFAFKSEVVSDKKPCDYMVYKSNINEINQQEYESVKSIPGVEKIIKYSSSGINVLIPPERLSKRYKELKGSELQDVDGKALINNSSIKCYGDDMLTQLKEGLSSGRINADELNSKNGVIILNTTIINERSSGKTVFTPATNYKPGDELEIEVIDTNVSSTNNSKVQGTKNVRYVKVKVAAILETSAVGGEYSSGGGISLITTEEVFKKLTGTNKIVALYVNLAAGAEQDNAARGFEKLAEKNPDLKYIDYSEMAENQNNSMIIIGIFIYGFIAVITLIGSINIINTISTNLILRTKELSMMKAVGMTKGAIKKMVCLESIFHGIIAAFFGGITGTLLSYWFYKYVANIREFAWSIPWDSIAIAGIGAVLVALLAGYLPLKKINNGVIIDNIRAEE